MLQRHRADEVGPAGQNAGSLRPAQCLAAGERHQVGALGDEPPQVFRWRQRGGGVYEHGHVVIMGDLRDGGQRQRVGCCHHRPQHARGAAGDRGGKLPRLGRPRRRMAQAAYLHQPDAHGAYRVVVAVAVYALHDHFVLQAACVRQAVHRRGVQPGHARRRAQQQPRRRPGGDVAVLSAGRRGDDPPGGQLQVFDPHEAVGRGGHGGVYFRRHPRAAEPGECPGCIDDRTHPEVVVDSAHGRLLQARHASPRLPPPVGA